MVVAPSIVPSGRPGALFTPVFTILLTYYRSPTICLSAEVAPDARGMLLVQAIGAAFWNFLYRPPLLDCRAMRSCSRAASSNSTLRRFHRPQGANLLHTSWPVSSRRTSYSIPSGFWVVRIMDYPVDQ